jgi:hypothetical protein
MKRSIKCVFTTDKQFAAVIEAISQTTGMHQDAETTEDEYNGEAVAKWARERLDAARNAGAAGGEKG